MAEEVEIKTTPPDLQQRIANYDRKLGEVIKTTNEASLHVLWEKVPPYPARPNSSYIRTGTLGRSLGVGMSGGKLGQPSLFNQVPLGKMGQTGTFGTNLEYAGAVIGDEGQRPIHRGIWWTISKVLNLAMEKIIKLHTIAGEEMVKYLSGL